MGSGQKHIMIGLSNAWVETAKISAKPKDIQANEDAARRLMSELAEKGFESADSKKVTGGHLLRDVPVELIDQFLLGWRNHDQAFLTQPGPVRAYIQDRRDDELKHWDVLVTDVASGAPSFELADWTIGPQMRKVGYWDLGDHLLSMSGKRARIASRGVEKIGVDPEKARKAEVEYLTYKKLIDESETRRIPFPDRIYRQVRDKPLFVLQVVKVRPPEEEDVDKLADRSVLDRLPENPVIG